MTRQLSMTEGKIGPALLSFAVPVLMSGFLQALYGAVDLLVVGRYDSSAAVSAVATGSQMMQTITGAVLGLSMGGTVMIGHAIGEKEPEKAARAVGTLAVLFAVIAAVCTAFMTLATGWVTGLLHTPRRRLCTPGNIYSFVPQESRSSSATMRSAAFSGASGTPKRPCTWWRRPVWSTWCWIFCWWAGFTWGP